MTHQRGIALDGASTAASLDEALAQVQCAPPAFCIGGGELYRAALAIASTAYVTEIAREFDGDTMFPRLDPAQWREVAREPHVLEGSDGFDYAFVTYERTRFN